MSILIGITGAIGSGKSTAAELLCQQEPSHVRYESGELIAELAEDFNRALSGELAFETSRSDIELTNQALIWFIESISEKLHIETTWNQVAITKRLTESRPELFQKLFAYLRIVKSQPALLDARITHENKEQYRPLLQWLGGYLVARLSGTVWYDELLRRIDMHDSDKSLVIIGGVRYPTDADVIRTHGGIILSIKRSSHQSDTNDVTEASRHLVTPDITLQNNGSLEALSLTIENLWNDIAAGNPAKTYRGE